MSYTLSIYNLLQSAFLPLRGLCLRHGIVDFATFHWPRKGTLSQSITVTEAEHAGVNSEKLLEVSSNKQALRVWSLSSCWAFATLELAVSWDLTIRQGQLSRARQLEDPLTVRSSFWQTSKLRLPVPQHKRVSVRPFHLRGMVLCWPKWRTQLLGKRRNSETSIAALFLSLRILKSKSALHSKIPPATWNHPHASSAISHLLLNKEKKGHHFLLQLTTLWTSNPRSLYHLAAFP